MIDTYQIFRDLSTELSPKAAEVLAQTLSDIYRDLKETVTRTDFQDLRDVVAELAEAQKRTEERVEELAEAQKRTEARVEELAEAQRRTEARVEELAEAQRRTEARVEELAEAQKRTEIVIQDLIAGQKRLEVGQAKLEQGQRELRQQFGALQQTFSYAFENEAYRLLPKLLEVRFGFHVSERILRKQFEETEVNFLAQGTWNHQPAILVGETKHRVQPSDVLDCREQIERQVEAVSRALGPKPMLRILVTHFAHDRAIEMLASADIQVIQSFEWL